jgi:hypothetical protein
MSVRAELLREYASRRWDLVQREKDRARAQRFRSGGPVATWTAALELAQRWRERYGETTDGDARRVGDLAHHLELRRKLDRATVEGRG